MMPNSLREAESERFKWVDRFWFERNQGREYRLRLATSEELLQRTRPLEDGLALWTIVRRADGGLVHFPTANPEGIADADATLRTFFAELSAVQAGADNLPFSPASF